MSRRGRKPIQQATPPDQPAPMAAPAPGTDQGMPMPVQPGAFGLAGGPPAATRKPHKAFKPPKHGKPRGR